MKDSFFYRFFDFHFGISFGGEIYRYPICYKDVKKLQTKVSCKETNLLKIHF